MAGRRPGSIQPLPADVVAQIKSSATIVSLAHVLLELLKNALDAGAATIDATVDFGRGGCSVEDDGLGIAPVEFRDEGGLGKLYCPPPCPQFVQAQAHSYQAPRSTFQKMRTLAAMAPFWLHSPPCPS